MLESKLSTGTSRTKRLHQDKFAFSLFWMSQCVACSPAWWILYHVTASCKGPIGSITVKAVKRLYLLRQLKRAGIDCNVLVRFYCSVIRSLLEYACQVFHCSLPNYLSDEIEHIQRRALCIIFPNCTYSEGLVRAGLPTLFSRRQSLCQELFHNIVSDSNHKLHQLLPPLASHNRRLRFTRMFNAPICKTNRFRDSFIISHTF